MNFKLFTLIVFVLFSTNTNSAQEMPKAEKTKTHQEKLTAKDYENLLSKLKGGDTSIDFTALRVAFVETKNYSYNGPEKSEQEKFFIPFNENKFKEALKQAKSYLEKDYVDANAHYVAYNCTRELKDIKSAEFHKAVLLGLLNSIKNGNDGLSAKTPFSVITIEEEYTLMSFLGFKHSSQSLQHLDGHTFDVFEVKDTKTNENVKLYFNIDIVWAAETKIFGK